MSQLKKREQLFCRRMAEGCAPAEAAAGSGFRLRPARAADRLLSREEIRAAIAEMENGAASRRAAAGYARIAYGSIADAVRLCFAEELPADLDGMDLFAVSELKRSKNGVEIKFHDRLKALDRLNESAAADGDRAGPFYRALEQAAERLG